MRCGISVEMSIMPINLALRNILRQKLRSGVTLMAVAFGVVGLILAGGFIQDIFIQLGEAIIHSQTGHLQVFKKDFIDKGTRSPERFMIENPAELEARIAQIQGVDAVMGRMYFSGLLNNGKRDFAIIGEGLEADKEARLGTLVMITEGRHLRAADTDGISFLPQIRNENGPRREWLYGWYSPRQRNDMTVTEFVFDLDYKLYADGRFFDLRADPFEKVPLKTGSLEDPATAAATRLRAILDRFKGARPANLDQQFANSMRDARAPQKKRNKDKKRPSRTSP